LAVAVAAHRAASLVAAAAAAAAAAAHRAASLAAAAADKQLLEKGADARRLTGARRTVKHEVLQLVWHGGDLN
jgi:hypothetical protein